MIIYVCKWSLLTHWGQVTHICIIKVTIIGSDNGLSPGHRQAIIWTNAGILLIGPLGINFNEILIKIHIFSFRELYLKMLSGNWRPFCLGLNVLSLNIELTLLNLEAKSQWPPLYQYHFHMRFSDENYFILISVKLKLFLRIQLPIRHIVGSSVGLVPKRWQDITWDNGDTDPWRRLLSLCHNGNISQLLG